MTANAGPRISPDHLPPLSICIPTYGRTDMLINTVRRVLEIAREDDEVIVVDQNEPPLLTLNIGLKPLICDRRLRVIHHLPPNLPAARNVAVSHSSKEVVLFLDDDVLLPSYCFDQHRHFYANAIADAVGGAWINAGSQEESKARQYLGTDTPTNLGIDLNGRLTGRNFSVKRDVYMRSGGFDEHFVGSPYYEDSDFSERLRLAGYRILNTRLGWLLHLCAPSGGCRITRHSRPEWQNSVCFMIYAFRHGRRTGEFWKVVWSALRAGPLRKENALRPWRWPWAWGSYGYAVLVAAKRCGNPMLPFAVTSHK